MPGTMLFNPYTGRPRDPRDIASDPAGLLIADPDEPLRPARATGEQPGPDSPRAPRAFSTPAPGTPWWQTAKDCGAWTDRPDGDVGYVHFGSAEALRVYTTKVTKQALAAQKPAGGWMEHLGFEVRQHDDTTWLVVDDCGGEREATLTERVLWNELVGGAVAQHTGEREHG